MKLKFKDFLYNYITKLSDSIKNTDIRAIEKASTKIYQTIKQKKTIYVCGNGGSAAISNHYICDYLKFLRQHSNLKPKIISLSTNIETITAISNDFDYSQVFKYQAESLFEKNDLLIVISSSGNSDNVKEVVKYSKKKGVKVIGFSGFDGGFLKKHSDISVHIDVNNYGMAEDSHHILMHIILQFLIIQNKSRQS